MPYLGQIGFGLLFGLHRRQYPEASFSLDIGVNDEVDSHMFGSMIPVSFPTYHVRSQMSMSSVYRKCP